MSGPGRRRQDYEEAVAYACAEFTALDAEVGGAEWALAIETVRTGEPHTAAWYSAVGQLHRLTEDAGIPGGIGLTNPMGAHTWVAPPPPVTGWVCPNGACERVQRADRTSAGQTAPECRLLGRPMRHVAG